MPTPATPRESTRSLEQAFRTLAPRIPSADNAATAVVLEAADRLSELRNLLAECAPFVLPLAKVRTPAAAEDADTLALRDLAARLRAELSIPA